MKLYDSKRTVFVYLKMFYKNNFAIQSFKVEPMPVNRNAFSVILRNDKEKKIKNTYTIAYAYKPLLYLSGIFAMNIFTFSRKSGIKKISTVNKLYSLVIIATYLAIASIVRPISWRQTEADLPLTILSKIFAVVLGTEIIYGCFIISFGKSVHYITLLEALENIDDHLGNSKNLYLKRRKLATILTVLPPIHIGITFIFESYRILTILKYYTSVILLLQGLIIIYFIIVIYGQTVLFNKLLLSKVRKMSSSKKRIFENDSIQKCLLKVSISISF